MAKSGKGRPWTADHWRTYASIAWTNDDWPTRVARENERTLGAIVAADTQVRMHKLTPPDIARAMDAGVLPDAYSAYTDFLAGVREWIDTPPTPEPEPAPPAVETERIPELVAMMAQYIGKLDAHVTALTEDIETLTNGLREWRKEGIAHYSVTKDKLVYVSGQLTALMRGFGVKPSREDFKGDATPTVGD